MAGACGARRMNYSQIGPARCRADAYLDVDIAAVAASLDLRLDLHCRAPLVVVLEMAGAPAARPPDELDGHVDRQLAAAAAAAAITRTSLDLRLDFHIELLSTCD